MVKAVLIPKVHKRPLPALVALEDVLPTVTTDSRVGRHRRTAPWTLQRLTGRLEYTTC